MDFQNGFWAFIEIMGHNKIAGFVKETQVAGKGFLSVRVPANKFGMYSGSEMEIPEHEKLISPDSIFSITPITQELAAKVCAEIQSVPLREYNGSILRQLEDKRTNYGGLPEDFEYSERMGDDEDLEF